MNVFVVYFESMDGVIVTDSIHSTEESAKDRAAKVRGWFSAAVLNLDSECLIKLEN